MSNEIPESKLERIRALLAKAEATEYEAERDAFMAAAMAQMAKYGIEQAALDAADPHRKARVIRCRIDIPAGAWQRHRTDLAFKVFEAMRCRSVLYHSKRRGYYLIVVGFDSDVERAQMMAASLLLQVGSALARLETPEGENGVSYRNAWLVGYRIRITRRLLERERRAEAKAERSGTGMELVLVDRRREVERAFEEAFPNVRIRRPARVPETGFRDGRKAANRANLGGTGVEQRRGVLTR